MRWGWDGMGVGVGEAGGILQGLRTFPFIMINTIGCSFRIGVFCEQQEARVGGIVPIITSTLSLVVHT